MRVNRAFDFIKTSTRQSNGKAGGKTKVTVATLIALAHLPIARAQE